MHKRYPDKERIDPIRGRLAAVALGMHTGEGLGQQRSTPEATASDREIDALLQAYQQLDGATDKGLSDTVRVREDLLSQSGLLVSRGDGRASFYHLSIQEFLAAERLFLLHGRERERSHRIRFLAGTATRMAKHLSFLFGCLIAKFSRPRGCRVAASSGSSHETPDSGLGPARPSKVACGTKPSCWATACRSWLAARWRFRRT